VDWKAFVVAMTGHIAWPCATLSMLFLVYWKRLYIIGIVKSIKYKDVELSFNEKLSISETKLNLEYKEIPMPCLDSEIYREIIDISKLDPSFAILKIWQDLVRELYELRAMHGVVRFVSSRDALEALVEQGKLSQDSLVLFDELKSLKDYAINEFASALIRPNDVVRYKVLVDALISNINPFFQGNLSLIPRKREEIIRQWADLNQRVLKGVS
jgi:hypothetical protein